MNKNVIYTAIFGKYDDLPTPQYIPDNWDFICFTDGDIKSDVWNIKKVTPLYEDSTRTARKYKILPHRFLQGYENSIWIDGNFLIKNDINMLWDEHIKNQNMAVYNHMHCWDKRNCIYEEANMIEHLFNINQSPGKQPKDNLDLIKQQMIRYEEQNYPRNNGLIISGILLRKHNKLDVIETMEAWWGELKYGSKRDQLSFDYVSWKNDFTFQSIHEDIRQNHFFELLKHNKHK